MGNTSIGKPGATSTINFGVAEGVIWTPWIGKGDTTIHCVIAGSGGLTKAATSKLVLTAANTYTGKTCVADGDLQVGDGNTTTSKLGDGDVEVSSGNSLWIKSKVVNAILDSATVTLWNAGTAFYGTMNLDSGVNETVGSLILDGKAQPAGTYGGKDSSATHKLDNYFSGSGILTVTKGK
jgi:fibronectin-binding autotransporter adhesin